jgi:hypothetical protein
MITKILTQANFVGTKVGHDQPVEKQIIQISVSQPMCRDTQVWR